MRGFEAAWFEKEAGKKTSIVEVNPYFDRMFKNMNLQKP